MKNSKGFFKKVCPQTQSLHNLEVLQNKALRILHFRGPRENSLPFCKISKIFKLKDLVRLYNLKFVEKHLNDFLPKNFLNYFTKTTNLHHHNTRGIRLNVPIVNITCIVRTPLPPLYKGDGGLTSSI